MPVFETPEPISVTIDIGVGDVQITAEDRTDTVVEVRPTDENDASDVKAAEQVRIEYADGVLLVKAQKRTLPMVADFSRKTRSVSVSIALPTGSHVRGEAALADLHGIGRLGECAYKTSVANIRLDHVGPLRLSTAGHITVGRVDGDAELGTATGRIRVGEIDGAARVKNSNGGTEIGTVTGNVHARSANGDISIERALGAETDAKTANGSVRLGEATRGTVVLKTSCGDLEVGIGGGHPAKLDLHTGYGRVENSLTEVAKSVGEAIAVRAQTSYGDITIFRA